MTIKERIMVVDDGTETAGRLYEELVRSLEAGKIDAAVEFFSIRRDTESGLSRTESISEFRGDPAHLAAHIGGTTVLLVHLAPVSREVIDAGGSLKLIGSARSSVANIDVERAREAGLPLVFCPGRNAQTVAEFTFGMLLSLLRSVCEAHRLVVSGRWDKSLQRARFTGSELEGKVLGIIGLGDIGRAVARIALGFGMELLGYDPCTSAPAPAGLTLTDSLEELLRRSDIVTLHARGDGERPILGAAELARMKPAAVLVNTSRGYLVDERALVESLKSGRLGGAALDVFSREPLPADSELMALENVLLTPHIAGMSRDMARRAVSMLVEDTLRFLQGSPPRRVYGKP